ncbi:hypothetical protein LJC41_01325 [Desulfosarcina sp. OttesenSCG-928-G17]|nr:hypothetical protein [Desulfosarcina sp. OttesenSCG-928-G17]
MPDDMKSVIENAISNKNEGERDSILDNLLDIIQNDEDVDTELKNSLASYT